MTTNDNLRALERDIRLSTWVNYYTRTTWADRIAAILDAEQPRGEVSEARQSQPVVVSEAMVERLAIVLYAARLGLRQDVAKERWPGVEQKSRFIGPINAALAPTDGDKP